MGSRIPSHQLSNGLYVSGRPEHHKERQPTIVSRPIPYTGGVDVNNNNNSADLAKMFDIPPPHHRASSSSSSSSKQRTSGSGPIQPTGLLVTSSGPIGSNPPTLSKGKSVYGSAVTKLGSDDVRLVFKVSKTLMWMLLVMGVIGLMVGTFLMVAVKKPLILLSVIGLLLLALLLILWNCACCCNKTRFISYLRNYPDTELRGAVDGQLVKVTGVVTCGSIPLESSFHKVPRCVYVSTEFYEYKGLRMMRNYYYSEKYVSDFYISDFHSGLRALVKAGYGAKVAPFVKQTTLIHITKQKLDSSPAFLTWLADRSLSSSSSDHHRLKEGYIKEGSTVSVMGVVRRHDNVLMIVPPTDDPISTGCQWTCGLFPTYVQGLVLTCDETQNADVIPV